MKIHVLMQLGQDLRVSKKKNIQKINNKSLVEISIDFALN